MSSTPHPERNTALYNNWRVIRRGCTLPGTKEWEQYGAHGVTICRSWLVFENFKTWALANGYAEGQVTLRRINHARVFSPDTCRYHKRKRRGERAAERQEQEPAPKVEREPTPYYPPSHYKSPEYALAAKLAALMCGENSYAEWDHQRRMFLLACRCHPGNGLRLRLSELEEYAPLIEWRALPAAEKQRWTRIYEGDGESDG